MRKRAGSSPVTRTNYKPHNNAVCLIMGIHCTLINLSRCISVKIRKFSLTKSIWYDIINNRQEFANMAQSAEHILGKDEVPGSNPGISSRIYLHH